MFEKWFPIDMPSPRTHYCEVVASLMIRCHVTCTTTDDVDYFTPMYIRHDTIRVTVSLKKREASSLGKGSQSLVAMCSRRVKRG